MASSRNFSSRVSASWLQIDGDTDGGSAAAACTCGGRTRPTEVPEESAEPFAADINLRMLAVQVDDDTFQSQPTDGDTGPYFDFRPT